MRDAIARYRARHGLPATTAAVLLAAANWAALAWTWLKAIAFGHGLPATAAHRGPAYVWAGVLLLTVMLLCLCWQLRIVATWFDRDRDARGVRSMFPGRPS